ncbi:M23 family metallopeptidase [Phototrophicus methaneseepsis]|uniref:M23 family metallopeptidase n=1 Tax=Phototrophicus methaneseepsis TaxID=2710758 RepID=A0A7S8IE47_9CHLR|nr:M23 family metallopeptidase [Phototrophicus methaneseepsis]QPC82231.1 M23 family metallopeptidase [Phototrophicus methaneseepsis]
MHPVLRLMPILMITLVMLLLSLTSVQGQTDSKPLILPFEEGPSLNTWLLGQGYGNTTGAYNNADRWYSAGQGMHFGLDFSAACGTPLVAVADATVAFVDDLSFGSAPHNLILRHESLGLTTLYGHLLNTPPLIQGQFVEQGQLVGYSGDPDGTCDSRPHLHLEIRSLDYRTTYNPVDYMDANWHSLALIGSFSNRFFQIDLDNARQWQTLGDQPDVAFGGRRLNAYAATWPPAFDRTPPASVPPAITSMPIPEDVTVTLQPLETTGCCADFWWHPINSNQLFTIDGAINSRASLFSWDVSVPELQGIVSTTPPPYYSPDFALSLTATEEGAQIQNIATGETWQVNTGGNPPAVNADNTLLMWMERGGATVPGQESPTNAVYLSNIRGEDTRLFMAEEGIDATWLDDHRLLLTLREQPNTRVDVVDIITGERYTLGSWYRPRAFSISPGGTRLAFYLSTQPNETDNGIYWIDIKEGAQTQKVSWIGAYRWRDGNSLFVVPFTPQSTVHQLWLYDIEEDRLRPLTNPTEQPFAIMDGRWLVNSDGSRIVFRNAVNGGSFSLLSIRDN